MIFIPYSFGDVFIVVNDDVDERCFLSVFRLNENVRLCDGIVAHFDAIMDLHC